MGFFGDKFKKSKEAAKTGFSNIIKKKLRGTGLDFHFTRAGERRLVTYKKYKPMIDYLKGINDDLIEIERHFENVLHIKDKVSEMYKFCGPYTDQGLIAHEQKYASEGTGVKTEKVIINGKEFSFKMPDKKKVYFAMDGREEEVSYFGYEQINFWKEEFCRFVDEACDHTQLTIDNSNYSDAEKTEKTAFVKAAKEKFRDAVMHLFRKRSYKEGDIKSISGYEFMFGVNYLRAIYNRLDSDYSSLSNDIKINVPLNVKYRHTYKIAVPVLRGYDGEVKDSLERHGINPSVDERGMPFEVDNEGKIMVGLRDGRLKGMQVPAHMIKEESLMKICIWVVNEWDPYRDDIRDGRYHPESLTVTDYLMANHPALGGEWKTKAETTLKTDKNNRNNDDRAYTMRLHDGSIVKGIRRPSNINPAFDLRAFNPESLGTVGVKKKDWIHIGRKYYYEDCTKIAKEEQDNPIATTRGTAMFLIDKFLSECKYLPEIKEDLKLIGEYAGFDYGPRAFGGSLCTDPFRINLAGANESVKSKKKD